MNFDDFHTLTGLIHRYADCADKGDFSGIAQLYADCVLHFPDGSVLDVPKIGISGYLAYYEGIIKRYPGGTPRTRHVMSNLDIWDDGLHRARAQSYVVVFQATASLPLQPIIAGTLHDRFERQEGRWRLVERREDLELVGNMSQHLLIAYPEPVSAAPAG